AGLVGISLFIVHFGDRYFLQRYTSLEEVGTYALAYKFGMMLSYVQFPFSAYWSSQIYKVLRGENGSELFVRIFSYYLLAMVSAALLLILFSGPLITLLAAPTFRSAAILVPGIVLAYLLRAAGDYFRSLFYLNKRVGDDAWLNLIASAVCLTGYI